ncbi:MAG TPA: DUF1232 domain-containing protein [Pyrinomonadaceae bacterium]|nr:DUF1232 domain-containing protein [Pyrinomonadaceae bacterium]
MSEPSLRSRMTNLLLFIPNMVLLCGRLMVDPRVPAKERLLVAGAVVYAFVPFDFLPDMLPFVGQIDDAYLIAMTLLRLMIVSDATVIREHWRGGGDVVELVGSMAVIASKLLPNRIKRVLTAQIETPSIDSVVKPRASSRSHLPPTSTESERHRDYSS